jgi:phosphoesterase RecJ-like protein
MNKQTKQLKNLIKKSKNILLITHKGPDTDAFASMLLTYKILKQQHPDKNIVMQSKKMPTINMDDMQKIQIVKKYEPGKEDLIIMTDVSRMDFLEERIDKLHESTVPKVAIDHHEVEPDEDVILINEYISSATEQVYVTLKEIYGDKFKLTPEMAEVAQHGIVADTGRFLYSKVNSQTFRVFAELVEVSRLDLETIAYKQSKFPVEATPAIIEFLKTLDIKKDMSYMYMSKTIIDENSLTKQGVNEAKAYLRDRYLRFIQGVHWGFIVSPGFEYDNEWFVSFRSTKGYQNVREIAEELGGGGHDYAAGINMTGDTIDDILPRILEAVEKVTGIS